MLFSGKYLTPEFIAVSNQRFFLPAVKQTKFHSSYNWSTWWQMGEYNGKKCGNMEIILIHIKTSYHFQWLNIRSNMHENKIM